jgi:hypothetical protein
VLVVQLSGARITAYAVIATSEARPARDHLAPPAPHRARASPRLRGDSHVHHVPGRRGGHCPGQRWPLPVPTRARCRHEQLRRGRFPAPGCLFSWLSRPSAPLGSSSGSRPTPTLRSRRLPVWSPSSSEQSSMSESASSTTSPYLRRLPRAGSGHAHRLHLYRNLMRRTCTAAGPLRSRQVPYVERDWSRSRA